MFAFLLAVVTSTSAVVLNSPPQSVLVPIDAATRGTQIANTFASSSYPHATGPYYPEFILQTTLPPGLGSQYGSYTYIVNGRLPFVQSIATTTYNTLLVVTYRSLGTTNTQVVVVPAEQIVDLIYVPFIYTEPPNNLPFVTTPVPPQVPFYSVDPVQRGADVVSAINQLLNNTTFTTALSQIWVQTTLTGPYSPPMNSLGQPGMVQNVLSASLVTPGMIQITYLPLNQAVNQTLLLTPEQVQLILYIPYYNTPWVPR